MLRLAAARAAAPRTLSRSSAITRTSTALLPALSSHRLPVLSTSSFPTSPSSAVRCFSAAAAATTDAEDSHSDFAPVQKQRPNSSGPTNSVESAKAQIAQDVSSHEVFLYMKGTPSQPRCGFSANVVKILSAYPGVKFGSRDVLEDDLVREAIKQYSDWPTLPQLFVKGEFVGGSDIVSNMFKSGELDKLLGATKKMSQ